jgi:3-hydroxyacyl-[acyl-carrier-protein] dehydratase
VSDLLAAAGSTRLVFPPSHPAFAGHFPQQPIVPGALLLDAALQAIEAADPSGPSAVGYHVAAVKFFRPVGPGEALALSWASAPDGKIQFEWCSDTDRIASGSVRAEYTVYSGRP